VRTGPTLFDPVTVVLELAWVLRSNFGFGKDAVLMTLSRLFSAAATGRFTPTSPAPYPPHPLP